MRKIKIIQSVARRRRDLRKVEVKRLMMSVDVVGCSAGQVRVLIFLLHDAHVDDADAQIHIADDPVRLCIR